MDAELAIEVAGLVKVFGRTRALDGVNLKVPSGCVYGFLGPNGAGKTTTIRILATLLRPDGGTARVFGHDVVREAAEVRRRVSLTGQFASVDVDLSGYENMVLLARLQGYSWKGARARAQDLLEAFDLAAVGKRQVKLLSGGMRRRLDVAGSLINKPDLLFLDEPTTGLDPRSRSQVWEVIRAIVGHGTTVLLTTQYLDEADQLADRIAVIDHGQVIAEDTRGRLKASVGSSSVRIRLLDPAQRADAHQIVAAQLGTEVHDDPDPEALTARIPVTNGADEMSARFARVLMELSRAGIGVGGFELGQPRLDEVFLALTGRPAPDHQATEEEA